MKTPTPEQIEEFEDLVRELRNSIGADGYDRDEHYAAVEDAAHEYAILNPDLSEGQLETLWHRRNDIV